MKSIRENAGFTLIEILIVVIILGILVAIVVPQFSSASVSPQATGAIGIADAEQSQIASGMLQGEENLSESTRIESRGADVNAERSNASSPTSAATNNPVARIESLPASADDAK